ncbi:MAG TPA: prepilin-type N-terminal cleavage/methylation domain-containing protein [Thermoanaerobaculia bacterium]|nr:prepilin-type N-terminal cleavage/methylation domain-containing protein [Thermoanaerobaculia bacterium]
MRTPLLTNRNSQRGYTLAEVLVASAIFTIIFIAALLIYDRSNQVFKQGVESSDMQQSTRVAFDQLVADVRMTGFDFDRDGRPFGMVGIQTWQPNTTYVIGNVVQPNPPNGHAYTCTTSGTSDGTQPMWPEGSGDTVTEAGGVAWLEKGILQYQQPDEQIEHMGATAITLRGNLDYEIDAATDNGREPNLESVYFPVVTTANDEIVTYVLKSADASKNTGKVSFYADVAVPRNVHPAAGQQESLIEITGVDLTNQNPPYTLYRYTIKEDGTPDAGTAMAENIRSLEFRYYRDTAGTMVVTANGGVGQYDAANPIETVERQERREIRSIHVNLVGMNPIPDGSYTHPTDTVAANYRQFQLETMIVPRNLGRRGMKELSVVEPGRPVIRTVCAGSCDVAYVTWDPSPKGDVLTYNILYDDDSGTGDFKYLEDAGNNLEGYAAKWITPNKTWYFRVQAINQYGFATSEDFVSANIINRTRPETPAGLAASGGDDTNYPIQPNQIEVYWPGVTTNSDSAKLLSCADGSTREQKNYPGNERHYYRLYRGETINFDPTIPSESTVIIDESTTLQPTAIGTDFSVADASAANCRDYYYRIRIVDYCARDATYNSPAQTSTGESSFYPAIGQPAIRGLAESTAIPEKVIGLSIANTACQGVNCDVTLTWSAVTKEAGNPTGPDISIDKYEVLIDLNDGLAWQPQTSVITTGGATSVVLPSQKNNESYRYRVRALNCAQVGAESDPVYFPCSFAAVIGVSLTSFGGDGLSAGTPWIISSPTSVTVDAVPAVMKIDVWVEQGGGMVGSMQTQTGTIASATFGIPQIADDEVAALMINVTDVNGCTSLITRYILDEAPPPCPGVGLSANIGPSGDNSITYGLSNSSADQLTLNRIRIVWDKALTPTPNGSTTIGSVTTDGFSASLTSSSSSGSIFTHIFTAQSTAPKLDAAESNYPVRIAYSMHASSQKLATNPITSVCIEYIGAQGDVIVCGVVEPGTVAASCTIP